MEIAEAITTEYREFDASTPVSKLVGAFKTHGDTAVLVSGDEGVEGLVTRQQLLGSQYNPDAKAGNVSRRDVPEIDRHDDIREVSRLMVETELNLLPVHDGETLAGVVTDKSIARAVEPFLDALDVSDVYTRDLRSVEPDTTLGEVIHTLRSNRFSRVPVIDDGDAVGMISYFDLLDFVVRETDQQQGGDTTGFDGHEGAGSRTSYRTTGGYGDRAGEESRILDLPARDVMNTPVATTGPDATLKAAVDDMLDDDYSSLVVVLPGEGPDGIVTLTDVLRSLTWTPDEGTRLQVFGTHLLQTMSREDVADLIETVEDKYEEMDVIEAYVILHEHEEKLRGTPLIRATIRLFTDRGRFAGTGEEYGDKPAVRAAKDRLERNVLDEKSHTIDERRAQRSDEEAERILGWWLEA